MDCESRNGDYFHANWAGWRFICSVLEELGCDTSEMSGSNDGDYVHSETAKKWGSAIKKNIDRIYVRKVPDKLYVGGFYHVPLVLKEECNNEVVGKVLAMLEHGAEPMSKETRTWLLEFAEFCINSGGFWQR